MHGSLHGNCGPEVRYCLETKGPKSVAPDVWHKPHYFWKKNQLLVEVRCWLHYKFTTQLETLVRVDSYSIRHEFIMTRWIIMRLLNYGSIICCRILKIWIGVHDLEVIMQALLLAILLGETGSCLLAPPVLLSVSVLMNQQLRYAPKIWIMGFKTG